MAGMEEVPVSMFTLFHVYSFRCDHVILSL